jgi:hypothetical protein
MTPAIAFDLLTDAGFRVEDKRPEREYFILTCRTCYARWSLGIRDGKVHPGNILVLSDHAAGHIHERHAKKGRELREKKG